MDDRWFRLGDLGLYPAWGSIMCGQCVHLSFGDQPPTLDEYAEFLQSTFGLASSKDRELVIELGASGRIKTVFCAQSDFVLVIENMDTKKPLTVGQIKPILIEHRRRFPWIEFTPVVSYSNPHRAQIAAPLAQFDTPIAE